MIIMPDSNKTPFSSVTLLEIGDEYAGQRVDNFLFRELKGVPKSKVYRILRKGEVRVNKKRVKADYKLVAGDILRVPPVRMQEAKKIERLSDNFEQDIRSAVLYEDKNLLIINKPSGLAVHGGSGINFGLIEALRVIYPNERHLELVHRLDRDTSGCIIVTKKRSVLKYLHELLRQRKGVDKRYQALVHGRWPNRRNTVSAPLMKNHLQSGERMVAVTADGKKSITEFSILERFTGATLVEARPITGRTHQIRVHAQYSGFPILGDTKYESADSASFSREIGLKRLFLHAASLRFKLPETNKEIFVEAPLDNALQLALVNAREE